MSSLVVISGATGMSGSETVRQLLAKGYRVIAFDNFFASSIASIQDQLGNPDLQFREWDVCDLGHMAQLEALIRAQELGSGDELSFINYAAVVHTRHFYEPEDTFAVNTIGMRSFLAMAVRLGANKYINCSTSEVYSLASYREGGVHEADPLMLITAEVSQRTSYATGKLLTEFFMKDSVDKGLIKGCSIRFANVYSSDELLPEHIIPYVIDALAKDGSVRLLNNARNTYRTFLHNQDSCSAVIALLETNEALDGTVYNVGTDEEILIPDLVHLIAGKMGITEPAITYHGERSGDPGRRLLNTEKIRTLTHWTSRVGLNEGLDKCIAFRRGSQSEVGS